MKLTIDIEETHPRFKMIVDAIVCPLPDTSAPRMSFNSALLQAREWQSVFKMAKDQKIEAIKAVRAMTGLGLKEAKDLVEAL